MEGEGESSCSPTVERSGGGMTKTPFPGPHRFLQVQGYEGRANDLIYLEPQKIQGGDGSGEGQTQKRKAIVYFGGDIQDYPELMEGNRESSHLSVYNLEATAWSLSHQFPTHHVIVVRPRRMQMLTFSCFDNFVPNSNAGIPDHTPNHGALRHLQALLRTLSALINLQGLSLEPLEYETPNDLIHPMTQPQPKPPTPTSSEGGEGRRSPEREEDDVSSTTSEEESCVTSSSSPSPSPHSSKEKSGKSPGVRKPPNPHLESAELTLVGFSKGAVVLNQFLYEFHYLKTLTPDDLSLENFLEAIHEMIWLDGGHNGGKNTWITSRALLETLSRLPIRLQVHMTPYQLNDERRPWIRREEKLFSEFLEGIGVPITRHVHFTAYPPSLGVHLQLVDQFTILPPPPTEGEEDGECEEEEEEDLVDPEEEEEDEKVARDPLESPNNEEFHFLGLE